MKFPRRHFLQLAGAAATASALPRSAPALDYPTRPVRWVVGYPPGGPQDIVARLVGQVLSERFGQQIIIENRSGAGGNIGGAEAVINAPPDGYTTLLVGSPNAINATLYDKLNFVFLRDIVPVASIGRAALVMEVHPSVPAKTVPEFIAYAKANPGSINYASAGNGTPQHVSGELFKMMAGVNMLHVPYRGAAPALTDLISGHVQVMFDPMPTAFEQIKAGRLRGLAVTTAKRSEMLPDLPTVGESLPGFAADTWYGAGVPRNTPQEIIEALNREINAALGDARVKGRLADLGATVLAGTPADFGRMLADETEKWGRVVRASGAKPE
jgi:tripartite-type tricarboxylate transporter receptor subunit TctC